MSNSIEYYRKNIQKYKRQLLVLDAQPHAGVTWQNVVSMVDPRIGLTEWKNQKKKVIAKRDKIVNLLSKNILEFRKMKLAEMALIDFQYYCSICIIIRDENEYLEEWLNWHIGQGVEHFYIYDHGSKEAVAEFVEELSSDVKDKITVIDFSGKHKNAQIEAYEDCLKKNAEDSRWIGFVDADEMVRVKNGKTLPEFLKDFEEHAGVMAQWIIYGANGQEKKSDAPLRERFMRIAKLSSAYDLGKLFVQPMLMKKMGIHNGITIEGFDVVDEQKNIVPEKSLETIAKTTQDICVDHYFTKSYEEWVEKLRRGTCDPNYTRRYKEFFRYNPDLLYCMEDVYPDQKYEISTK